ncbi:MAG: AsnC-type helix-turn-helix domain, partial [Actinomycetota bacterium]
MKNPQPVELDDVDRALLKLLQDDARMTNADLAATVGIAASTCPQRDGRHTRTNAGPVLPQEPRPIDRHEARPRLWCRQPRQGR